MHGLAGKINRFNLFIYTFQITFQNVVDPLDFEDFILQHQPLADDNKTVLVLSEFPDDDIEVTNIPRLHRTIGKPVPDAVQ